MTPPCLLIAYSDERSRVASVTQSLRSQGHEVAVYDDARACLAAPEAGLYLLGRTLADGSSGLDLLEALRRTGRSAPVLILAPTPHFAEVRRAVELGATEVLFGAPEPSALAAAIERAGARTPAEPRGESEEHVPELERRYPAKPDSVGRAAREISAFLVNEGVAVAHRVRIASALAELVDNACRHAYGRAGGEVAVRVALQAVRVQLVIEDSGNGFDVGRQRLERIPPALPSRRGLRALPAPAAGSTSHSGLGRIERLCESHTITSGPHGTRVELTFELTPVRFEEEPEHLSSTDFLDPTRARSLIAALESGRDLSGIPPAMALTVGRILGGLPPRPHPHTGA